MGECLSNTTVAKQQQVNGDKLNPYGINTSAAPYQENMYPNLHNYYQSPQTDEVAAATNQVLANKLSQHHHTINSLNQKIKQQQRKIVEQENQIKNSNKGEKEDQSSNAYKGFRNYGKQNALQLKDICCSCKINKMNRFLDYSKTKFDCKCGGFGVVEGKKTNVKCSEWFCRNYVTTLQICPKCYGHGFRVKKDWYENIF